MAVEIGGHTRHPVGKRLSNFTARPFVFDRVKCASFEGIIQAIKCPDIETQRTICGLVGIEAKRAGAPFNTWKDNQQLHWNGSTFNRHSRDYFLFISRIYDAIYEQDETLRKDLMQLKDAEIVHSIGNPDMRNTTLTEVEMMMQIYRLRVRALTQAMAELVI